VEDESGRGCVDVSAMQISLQAYFIIL